MTPQRFTGAGWKTERMIQAEIELDEAVHEVDEDLAKAAERDFSGPPLSDEDVRRFEQAARDERAPKEMQELAKRVDRGEYTWRDITDGRAIRQDPAVRAAFAEAGKHVDASPLAKIAEQLREGKSAEEIVAAAAELRAQREAGEGPPEPEREPREPRKPAPPVTDDEYFEGSPISWDDGKW